MSRVMLFWKMIRVTKTGGTFLAAGLWLEGILMMFLTREAAVRNSATDRLVDL